MNNQIGYLQAINNIAFELDRFSEEIDNSEEDLACKIMTLMAPANEDSATRNKIIQLDHIISIIGSTYHRTVEEVEKDIDVAVQKIVMKHLTGEK